MGRGPTNQPGRWGVRWPVHADQVGVQHSPPPSPDFAVATPVSVLQAAVEELPVRVQRPALPNQL
jgi:hypothetical protein